MNQDVDLYDNLNEISHGIDSVIISNEIDGNENKTGEIEMDNKTVDDDKKRRCDLCNERLNHALSYSLISYEYCKNCFHIRKSIRFINYEKTKYQFNRETFTEYILSKIFNIELNEQDDLKILVLNDIDSILIDTIYDKMCEKVDKYRLKTVSASPFYNNSFFSPHKHSKHTLTEYVTEMLSNEWNKFDIIVLNDMLTYTKNPCEILQYCKTLSHKNTVILSVNLHTSIIYSMDLLNMDINVNNIFNTSSLKRACYNVDLKLEQALLLDNVWLVSTITGGREEYISKEIVSKLYGELTSNIYETSSYEYNCTYWYDYFYNLNTTLRKYSDIGYQVILIGNLPENIRYGDIEYDKYLQTKDLQFIDNLIGSKFTVLVVTDYKNTKSICDTICNYSKTPCLIYDLFYCIGYELRAMVF